MSNQLKLKILDEYNPERLHFTEIPYTSKRARILKNGLKKDIYADDDSESIAEMDWLVKQNLLRISNRIEVELNNSELLYRTTEIGDAWLRYQKLQHRTFWIPTVLSIFSLLVSIAAFLKQ